VLEERQPHLRGGAKEPLSRTDLEEKFRLNCAYGGWPERADAYLAFSTTLFEQRVDLAPFRA
jgi:hypothetical protein